MGNTTEKRITAKMVLDSTGYNSKLQGLNAEMKKHQAALKLASQGVKSFGKDGEKLKSVQQALSKQMEVHTKKVDLYQKSIDKTNNKLHENIKTRDNLKKSLDQANRKYDEAVKIYGKESEQAKKAKKEVDKLKEEHKKATKTVETNAKEIQNYETNLDKAKAQMAKTKGELKKVNDELDKSSNKWLRSSEKLKKSSEKLKNIGGKLSGVGDSILKVAAPLAAGGLASLKFSTDFETSMGKVSTIADNTEVPMSDLRKGILNLSNDTGIASTEIANNVYDAISAGQKTGDAVNFVSNSTKLAKSGFAEAGQSLDLLTTIMNSYGMKSKEVNRVSDVLINTQNKGKVTVGELSSVMGKVIPTANAFGVNLEQVASGYAIMTSKGIKAAETTTYMGSMLNELGKNGTKASVAVKEVSGKSFQDLIKSGKTVGDVLNMMNDHAKKNGKSLSDLFGSAEAGKAALILSANAGKDFNNMLGEMKNSVGATDEAFKKVSNTRGERFKKSLNKMKNAAIKLGDALGPIMDKVSVLISKIADKLSGLSNEQINSIVKWGSITMAAGGFMKVLGGGISTIGNIVSGISTLKKVFGKTSTAAKLAGVATEGAGSLAGKAFTGMAGKTGLLRTALSGVKGAGGLAASGVAKLAATVGMSVPGLGLAVAGVAAVGYGAYKLHQHMKKDAVPAVDLFDKKMKTTTTSMDRYGNKITVTGTKTINFTKQTKKAVGQFVKDSDKVGKTVFKLCANQTKITAKTAKEVTQQYINMGNKIKQSEDVKYKQRLTSFKQFLDKNKNMSAADKAQALKKMQETHLKQQQQTDNYTKKIAQILDNARKNNRSITAEEQKEINDIQEKMKTQGIKKLSTSEKESRAILSRLKQYGTRITAEQASEVIKNAEKQRQGSVKKAEAQYKQTVAQIKRMRDEDHTITKDQATKMINEAERQKKESIKKAEQHKNGVVKQIKKMNSDTIGDIDTTDGHIKSRWEKLKDWFANNKIVRWIKSKVSGDPKPEKNWTGNNYFKGGLTYLHDAPGRNNNYELYDLPRGTRIFNHDASQDLVMQTAEDVATKVANSVLKGFGGANGINVTQNIYSPIPSPSEIARQSKNNLRELALNW